ncbi:MAG: hypothetical protein KC502_18420 [Myxococcales bacterium]|nr:hypothetical protein [Myxococcales bacterium]
MLHPNRHTDPAGNRAPVRSQLWVMTLAFCLLGLACEPTPDQAVVALDPVAVDSGGVGAQEVQSGTDQEDVSSSASADPCATMAGAGCTVSQLPYDEPFACDKGPTWWLGVAGALNWGVDASPSVPKPLSGVCSLNLNDGQGLACPSTVAIAATGPWIRATGLKADAALTAEVRVAGQWPAGDAALRVEIRTLAKPWQVVGTIVPNSQPWQLQSFSLAKWVGSWIRIRFRYIGGCDAARAGPFVDDLRVYVNGEVVPPETVCGDGLCEGGETSASCPVDCAAETGCTGGDCCDLDSGEPRAKGTQCGGQPLAETMRCEGAAVQTQQKWATCIGGAPNCATDVAHQITTDWKTLQSCAAPLVCKVANGLAACVAGQPDPTGACWNSGTKSALPKGTPCGKTVVATDKSCQGNDIMQKTAVAACDGVAKLCPSDKSHLAWGPPVKLKTCAVGQSCVPVSGQPKCVSPPKGPDLVALSLGEASNGQKAYKPGQYVPLSGKWRNAGDQPTAPYKLGFLFGAPTSDVTTASLVKALPQTAHGTGQTRAGSWKLKLKSPLVYGPYQVIMHADHGKEVAEASETNNAVAVAITVGECLKGPCCDSWKLRPKGTKCSTGPVAAETRCDPTDSTRIVQRRQAWHACTGASELCSTSMTHAVWSAWTKHQTCNLATHYCKPTSSKTATCATKGKPNLKALKLEPYGVLKKLYQPGDTVKVVARFQNTGASAAGPFANRFYVSKSSLVPASGHLAERAHGGLGAGKVDKSFPAVSVKLPAKMSGGGYYIGVRLDAKSQVAETTELDNKTTLKINVGVCATGVCCNTTKKTLKLAKTKCSTAVYKTVYACSSDLKRVMRKRAYRGCTGKSATLCSSSSTYLSWTSATIYKTCATTQVCKAISSTSATCVAKPLPDLQVDSVKLSTASYLSGSVKVSVVVRNVGKGASGSWSLKITSSPSGISKSYSYGSLAPGATKSGSTTLYKPSTIKWNQTFTLTVTAVHSGSEVTKSNNAKSASGKFVSTKYCDALSSYDKCCVGGIIQKSGTICKKSYAKYGKCISTGKARFYNKYYYCNGASIKCTNYKTVSVTVSTAKCPAGSTGKVVSQ